MGREQAGEATSRGAYVGGGFKGGNTRLGTTACLMGVRVCVLTHVACLCRVLCWQSAEVVQGHIMGEMTRRHYKGINRAGATLQGFVRGDVDRRRSRQIRELVEDAAAEAIQGMLAGWETRLQFRQVDTSVDTIQALVQAGDPNPNPNPNPSLGAGR